MGRERVSVYIIVSGRVQGVGFRYYVYQRIINDFPSCTGYVKNLITGEVEVFLEGPKDDILNALPVINSGPSYSHVAHMDIQWGGASNKFREFEIKL